MSKQERSVQQFNAQDREHVRACLYRAADAIKRAYDQLENETLSASDWAYLRDQSSYADAQLAAATVVCTANANFLALMMEETDFVNPPPPNDRN